VTLGLSHYGEKRGGRCWTEQSDEEDIRAREFEVGEKGENFIIKSFIILTSHQILFGMIKLIRIT